MAPGRAATFVLLVTLFIAVTVATPVAAQSGTTITVGGYTWDPLAGPPAAVPEILRTESYAPGERGLWLVQYVSPLTDTKQFDQLAATGFLDAHYGPFRSNGFLWVGTPEQAALVRALPFVRCVDLWYPFEKGNYQTRFEPDTRLQFVAIVANVAGVDAALADVASYGAVLRRSSEIVSIVVRQSDLLRLLHNRYVIYLEPDNSDGMADPHLFGVLPRSALPSQSVVISGTTFGAAPVVTFRGVPSPRVVVRDLYRIEAEVPAGLAPGPADIVVTIEGGSSQIFPAGHPGGFSVAPAGRTTLAKDDAVESEYVPFCCFEGGSLRFRWSDPRGLPRLLADLGPTAVAFDGSGRLLVATYYGSAWYDRALQRVGDGPAGLANANALLFDAQNDLIAVAFTTITRVAANGVVTTHTGVGGPDADLDADQCTLYLAGAPIQRFNVCTMTPLAPVNGTSASHLRVLPDGTLLAVSGNVLRRYRMDGTIVEERVASLFGGGAVALSSDGKFARIGGGSARYDIAAGTIVATSDLYHPDIANSLAVYGGWTAARGFAHYADGEVDAPSSRRRAVRP